MAFLLDGEVTDFEARMETQTYLHVVLENVADDSNIFIINTYGPRTRTDRQEVWNNSIDLDVGVNG